MANTPSTDSKQLLEELATLARAVKQLAERVDVPVRPAAEVTEADRIRQRVAFGYQVLGTLMGRVSSASDEFDVRLVGVTRDYGRIDFVRLPRDAAFVELRSGTKVEVLRIEESDSDLRGDGSADAERPRNGDGRRGHVRPKDVEDTEPIGSVLFLRDRRGPLVAFGPRLLALQPAQASTSPLDPRSAR
ncbi:hypothetical protein [Pseudonocardia charpentierae]|uniref:Uncharacterized protein n=1 Tax=Pseudonocardia charpentierae TaxID=3075545 RepID=A0ABU2NLA4_9PSEU|nr:hypothetical protein [Pseudonocardia sp. DSM 45834]MDT0354014.1 hypothetical protein [Pseudonocardia sp. DSM 45834]